MTRTDTERFSPAVGGADAEDFGHALRTIRKTVGASLTKLARQTSYSESYLRSVENGNRAATLNLVEACDSALETGGVLVDLFLAERDGDDVRRRTVLAALGTVTGLGITTPGVVAEALRASLLSVLGVDDWEEIATEYGRRFVTDPPAVFRAQLSGDLLVLRRSMGESDSAGARLAAPRLMTLHGMVTANLGDAAGAARWYRAARLAADRTNDHRLRQWVRGREAFRRGYEGAAPREVLAIASEVRDVEAKLATAQAYARLDDNVRAGAALADARRIHEDSDRKYSVIPWSYSSASLVVGVWRR